MKQEYHATGNKFERFRVFLELISRFEFEFCRLENYFFERFEFLVCSCECAVACLCPRNSISHVVASVMIHDAFFKKIKWKRCSKKHETIVEGHKHRHVHLHVHLHIHIHLHLHIHRHIHICIYTCTCAFAFACACARVGRWVGEYVLVRVCVVLVFVSVVLVFVSVVLVFVSLCWCLCVLCVLIPQDC